jgi:hypothetical protein
MKFVLLLYITCILAVSECSLLGPRLALTYAFSNTSNGNLAVRVSRELEDITVNFPDLRARGLFARQETCSDPADGTNSSVAKFFPAERKYVKPTKKLLELCPDGITCCPAGDNCVSGGCCPSGEIQCGSSKCYDPDTEICCSNGIQACSKGQDCVTGGCCPSGEVLCGSSKCYDPSTEFCCSDGTRLCVWWLLSLRASRLWEQQLLRPNDRQLLHWFGASLGM